jgi:Domain of unknown function (DUF1905)
VCAAQPLENANHAVRWIAARLEGPSARRDIFVSSCEPDLMTERLTHTGPLWRWTSDKVPAAWHFVTIDGAAGEALSATALMRRLERSLGGFGSLKVAARIGDSVFRTSVFPAKELGWLLPVKAAVRKAEGIAEGDVVEVWLEV